MSFSAAISAAGGASPATTPPLPETQNDWSGASPQLPTPSAQPNATPVVLPDQIETDSCKNVGRLKRFGTFFRKNWDRGTLASLPRLATPAILLGIGLVLIGSAGVITAFTGKHIPGIALITKNAPVSLFLSLMLIRSGIHAINSGTRLSRRKQRFRQDVIRCHTLFHIEQNMRKEGEARIYTAKEVGRRDARAAPSKRLCHPLSASAIYGKQTDDVCAVRKAANTFFAKMHLLHVLPHLEPPLVPATFSQRPPIETIDLSPSRELTPPNHSFVDKWYDWWHARLPLLGKLDIALGIFMAIAGVTALFLLLPVHVPPGFEVLVADPMLSVSFALLLILNSLNCIRSGWKMLGYNKREAKRAEEERELQLLDRALEIKRAKDLYIHLSEKTHDPAVQREIESAYNTFLAEVPKIDLRPKEKGPENKTFSTKLGEGITPYFSTPTILLGVTLAIVGTALLGMCVSQHVPPHLAFLASKPTLSILFATTLIIAGLHAVHRGGALADSRVKKEWNVLSIQYRKEMLHYLADELPEIAPPAITQPHRKTRRKVPSEVSVKKIDRKEELAKIRAQIEQIRNAEPNKWYEGWMHTFKGLWVPDLALGSFLLVCSLAGIAFALGAPITGSMRFVVESPSYSLLFCLSLLGIAIDTLDTTWTIGTYHKQRKERLDNLEILETCYKRLFDCETEPLLLRYRA